MIDDRDPFGLQTDVEPTVLGPLAERDPNAAPEESAEYRITGAESFDDVLVRARRKGFVAGAAAGGLAGAVLAGLLALAVSRRAADSPAPAGVLVAAAPDTADGSAADPAALPPRAVERGGARRRSSAVESSRGPADRAVPEETDGAAPRTARTGSGPGGEAQGDAVAAADPEIADRPASRADETSTAAPAVARPPQERDVTAALGARRDALDACVEDTPGDGTAARGRRFRLLVVIEPSGRVSEARVYDDEIAATPLGVCLVRLARETTFAPFDGEPARLEVRVRNDDAG